MVENRHPDVAAVMVRSVHDQNIGHHLQGAVEARQTLVDTGFGAPSWEDLARGLRPAITFDDDDPTTPLHGWQFVATRAVHSRFIDIVVPRLPKSSRAMLRSQSGPLANVRSHAAQLPDTPRVMRKCSASFSCVACGSLFPLPAVFAGVAVHSISVATTVLHVLWRGSWEVAGSQWSRLQLVCVAKLVAVCLSTLQFATSMLDGVPDVADGRQLEVVADGLPLFHGAQIAVDTTFVSVLRRDGTPHPRCSNEWGRFGSCSTPQGSTLS